MKKQRPGRKLGAAKRQCARAQLLEVWQEGKSTEIPAKVRVAIETLVPELTQVKESRVD